MTASTSSPAGQPREREEGGGEAEVDEQAVAVRAASAAVVLTRCVGSVTAALRSAPRRRPGSSRRGSPPPPARCRRRAGDRRAAAPRARAPRRASPRTPGPGSSGARNSIAWAPASSSIASAALRVREHLQRQQTGGVPHRDVILLAGARRNRVDARRMAEHLVLGDERSGHVLGDHEPRVEPALDGQERRQALRQRRVDEPLDPSLRDRGELGDREREHVEPERERLTVEVPVRDDEPLVDEDERVVGRRVQLDGDRRLDVVDQVAAGTVHLRRAAERVGVLDAAAPAVRLDDRRALEQADQVRGRVALAAQRPRRVNRRMEARARALQRLERERAREVGGACAAGARGRARAPPSQP